jgi:hypothetical protein
VLPFLFLQSVITLFDQISVGNRGVWKPIQTGVILSTLSVLELQDRLINSGNFKFLLTSRLTQDCLENLFSCVRSKNPTPTPLELKNNLRLLTVAQYLKGAENGSYDLDEGGFEADFLVDHSKVQVEEKMSDDVLSICKPFIESRFTS